MRDRALFDLAIDSKLRGCDLVKIKIGTLVIGSEIHHSTAPSSNNLRAFVRKPISRNQQAFTTFPACRDGTAISVHE